ncbi:ATP-binding cassette domain-containing protein [Lacticaseibacillus rhamnosus]
MITRILPNGDELVESGSTLPIDLALLAALLAGVSLQAGPGVFGLLGPNGAGKTTALRILSTVLEPSSGTAIVGGFDVVTQPDMVRHQIGFVSAPFRGYLGGLDRFIAGKLMMQATLATIIAFRSDIEKRR